MSEVTTTQMAQWAFDFIIRPLPNKRRVLKHMDQALKSVAAVAKSMGRPRLFDEYQTQLKRMLLSDSCTREIYLDYEASLGASSEQARPV